MLTWKSRWPLLLWLHIVRYAAAATLSGVPARLQLPVEVRVLVAASDRRVLPIARDRSVAAAIMRQAWYPVEGCTILAAPPNPTTVVVQSRDGRSIHTTHSVDVLPLWDRSGISPPIGM